MQQRGSHWTNFQENLYVIIFRKSAQKIQVSLKSDKNNGYFAREMFQTKDAVEIKTHIFCSVTFFSFENCIVYEIMWKNNVEWGRPQMTIWRRRNACCKATNTLIIRNTYCFSTATMVPMPALTLRWLTSYIYGAPILDVSRSHQEWLLHIYMTLVA